MSKSCAVTWESPHRNNNRHRSNNNKEQHQHPSTAQKITTPKLPRKISSSPVDGARKPRLENPRRSSPAPIQPVTFPEWFWKTLWVIDRVCDFVGGDPKSEEEYEEATHGLNKLRDTLGNVYFMCSSLTESPERPRISRCSLCSFCLWKLPFRHLSIMFETNIECYIE